MKADAGFLIPNYKADAEINKVHRLTVELQCGVIALRTGSRPGVRRPLDGCCD